MISADGAGPAVEVAGPDGARRFLGPGDRLAFGRGPDVDLPLGEDRWMSRRLGHLVVSDGSVHVVNDSRKLILHVKTEAEIVQLPAATPGASDVGCTLFSGVAMIGSAAMLRERRALVVTLPDRWRTTPDPGLPVTGAARNLSTVPPLRLNPATREFMVALLLCRPWLEDQSRVSALPSVPQIGRQALTVTHAHHRLAEIERDAKQRDQLTEQIKGQIKQLREKLQGKGYLPANGSVGHTSITSTLIHYDIITRRDLALFDDDHWISLQENRWWR
jgi:hypothetical protein